MRLVWFEEGGGATCAELLATVPHWFGKVEANEEYRRVADRCPTLVAMDGGQAVGFLTVVRHSPHAAELHVMAVRPELHRHGIGRTLVAAAEERLRSEGVEYLQVKTLSAAADDQPYLGTLAFYTALDFRVLEEMPDLWDADNAAVLLIKHLDLGTSGREAGGMEDTGDAGFSTEVTVAGPWRLPVQMLEEQDIGGHSSIHDGDTAASLGLDGAPIEAPTHFSQIDPLAAALWGRRWFERGCVSGHFRTMVVEGEQVQATATTTGPTSARVEAHKADGTPVLVGTASIGPDHPRSELDERLARLGDGDPGELFVVDQLRVGMRSDEREAAITRDDRNGPGYPFSLAEKLERITEPHPWYTAEGGALSPWGRAVVPMEMISVLSAKAGPAWPVRGPALGLFLDLEIRLVDGPVFVDQAYRLQHEVVGLSQSRRTESYWTRTTITDADTGRLTAVVLLHSGVFKESYAGYPKERLA